MKKLFVSVGLAAMLVPQIAQAKEMQGWRIEGSGTGIVPEQRYSLYNLDQERYLGYQDRSGANLGWDTAPNQGMMVKRQSAENGPIKCGEVFGLFAENEWVIYEKQTTGINLSTRTKLTNDAWYQWKFTNCQTGEVVPLNQPVTLTNTVENDSIVGGRRVWGVNLCWANTVVTFRGKNYHKDAVPGWVKEAIKKSILP